MTRPRSPAVGALAMAMGLGLAPLAGTGWAMAQDDPVVTMACRVQAVPDAALAAALCDRFATALAAEFPDRRLAPAPEGAPAQVTLTLISAGPQGVRLDLAWDLAGQTGATGPWTLSYADRAAPPDAMADFVARIIATADLPL